MRKSPFLSFSPLTLVVGALLMTPALVSSQFVINQESLANAAAKVLPLVEKETRVELAKKLTFRITTPGEIEKILVKELQGQLEAQFGKSKETSRQVLLQSKIMSQALMAKYAIQDSAILVCPGNIARLAKLVKEPLLKSRPAFMAVLIHECVHGADDLKYGFTKTLNSLQDTNAFLAFNAVIEGHAQHVTQKICQANNLVDGFKVFTKCIGKNPDEIDGNEASNFMSRILTVTVANAYYQGKVFVDFLAAKAMQKSEVKYRSLFEQAGDYILVLSVADNRDILIVNANQAAFSTHGYTRDEFLGLSINELDRSLDEDQLRSTFDRVLAGEAVRFETTRARKDGSVFPVEVSCSLLSTSDDSPLITSIERDITERVQAEEEARKFKTIFDNSNSGCVIADLAGHIEYTNSYMSAIHGYTPEELLGAPLTIFHSEKQMEVVRDFLPSMLKNSSFGPLEVGHTHRDGTEFPMMMTGFIMEGDSKSHRYMVVTAIDITREAELEKQLHQAKRLETVGQLAGGVAHDFNDLLHVIRGFTDIAFSDLDPNNPAIASLEEVTKATQRASNLVNQLLAFSRRQVLEMSDVDLNAVIKNMMKMVARIIGEHIKVDLRIGPDLSVIRADPGQIELILMNLCVNARDAMPSGGVLTIETGVVSLGEAFCQTNALEKTGPYAVVGVQDTGCGIKAADLEKIFEPFYTTKEVGRGTGLGLSTVYGLIKQHHGLIRAQSETGKGTTFTIHLPLINRPAAKEVKKNMDSIPRGRETLLVAEDDPAILKLLKTLLERSGYTVFTADNGEEALRVFREKAGSLDLVLLDVMMPKLSGREVYDTIQKEQPGMKVVFSSGYSLGGVHTSFVLDEGLHFIRKPCPSEDLLRKIRSVLEAAN